MIDNGKQQVLGKYEIIKALGEGGFATVYHAVDSTVGVEVALKILKPDKANEPEVVQRFKQEAKITAGLFHPNIVSFFEIDQIEGRQYIALRYVPGKNLRDRLKGGETFSLDQIVAIVGQVSAALDYAHDQDVVHRDVKPSNIILDDKGHVTLIDFGIVKALINSSIETTFNAVVGTPNYLSPEQAESKTVDRRSDQYSLGIVAYHLLTEQLPFLAETTPSLLYKIVHEDVPSPSDITPRAEGAVGDVVLKAMAKEPAERYATCKEFAESFAVAVAYVKGEKLQALCQEARAHLNAADILKAEAALNKASAIAPNQPEIKQLQEDFQTQHAYLTRYGKIHQQLNMIKDKALALRADYPAMPDPDGIFEALSPKPSANSRIACDSTPIQWSLIVLSLCALIALVVGIFQVLGTDFGAENLFDQINRLAQGDFLIGLSIGIGISNVALSMMLWKWPKALWKK
jgi:serine/threonine protein kinase